MTDADILAAIFKREAGYVDDPRDRGGATNMGITQAALAAWRDRPVTKADVKALTKTEATAIYRRRYIERPGFQSILNPHLRGLVVDCGVNHGTPRVARWLQQAVGVKLDGVIGPVTRLALEKSDPVAVYVRICAIRTRWYGRIIADDHSQAAFSAGWANRNAEFIEVAADI